MDGDFLKITSTSTGSSSSITIKAGSSGTHAQALFGVGTSVAGAASYVYIDTSNGGVVCPIKHTSHCRYF